MIIIPIRNTLKYFPPWRATTVTKIGAIMDEEGYSASMREERLEEELYRVQCETQELRIQCGELIAENARLARRNLTSFEGWERFNSRNWGGYDEEPVTPETIEKAKAIARLLSRPPDAAPCGDGSVGFEWVQDKEIIDVYHDGISIYARVGRVLTRVGMGARWPDRSLGDF
jgi:hypothetical protein